MHGGVYNKHNSKICDNNCTKVRRGEMEVHHCKDLVLYSTVYTVYYHLTVHCNISPKASTKITKILKVITNKSKTWVK